MKIIDKEGVDEMEVANISLVAFQGSVFENEEGQGIAAVCRLKIKPLKQETQAKINKYLKDIARMFGEILDFDNQS